MAVITQMLSFALRAGQLIFASIVAGIVGSYLHDFDKRDAWPQKRFIYTEVIAGVSILFSLLWLLPFVSGSLGWPMDLILSAAWFAAFGLLVDQLHGQSCGRIFNWSHITDAGFCNRWKAAQAFSFLSAILWLTSAILGVWLVSRKRKAHTVDNEDANNNRRPWYRRARV